MKNRVLDDKLKNFTEDDFRNLSEENEWESMLSVPIEFHGDPPELKTQEFYPHTLRVRIKRKCMYVYSKYTYESWVFDQNSRPFTVEKLVMTMDSGLGSFQQDWVNRDYGHRIDELFSNQNTCHTATLKAEIKYKNWTGTATVILPT